MEILSIVLEAVEALVPGIVWWLPSQLPGATQLWQPTPDLFTGAFLTKSRQPATFSLLWVNPSPLTWDWCAEI